MEGSVVIYRQDPRSATRILRGEAAIIPPQDGRLNILNKVATEIWSLCDADGRSLDSLVGELSRRYEAPLTTIRDDTLELLEELVSVGALIREKI